MSQGPFLTRCHGILRMVGACMALAAPPFRAAADTPITALRVTFSLEQPVFATAPPGDTRRIFVVEKAGTIRVLKDSVLLSAPFLDIVSQVLSDPTESGLLGLAFHPDYDVFPRSYVSYVDHLGNVVIAGYEATSGPDVADPKSGYPLLVIPHGTIVHFGGWLGFGPDGYLYIAVGDANMLVNAQDRNKLLGKILRIDVNGDDFPGDPNRNYAIPPDNPFVGREGADEIWAFGLRNPWRCSFDRATGDLYITDVGSSFWEEVNLQPAGSRGGLNYGWPCVEADRCRPASGCPCDDPSFVAPMFAYPHVPSCAIIGGYVYRGCAMPDFYGAYFFADHCSGNIWSFRPEEGRAIDLRTHTKELTPLAGRIRQVTSFGEDADGELYFSDYQGDELFKIVPRPECGDCNRNGNPDACDIQAVPAADSDGNGILDSCQTARRLLQSDPPSGSVDARQAWEGNIEFPAGWSELSVTFNESVGGLGPGDFCIRQEGGDLPPVYVVEVQEIDQFRVRLGLNRPVNPCAWMVVSPNRGQGNIRLGLLPGDVNGDETADAQDVAALAGFLGSHAEPGIWSVDINRSGEKTPEDLIRVVDILHGLDRLPEPSTCP